MKHSQNGSAPDRLVELCAEGGVSLPSRDADTIVEYLLAIIQANTRINLTRIETIETGMRLHLVDSLMALPEVCGAPEGPLCDIGTGGGFPGVPIALATKRECVLLDSVSKKAAAVNEVLETLSFGKGISATAERAEHHARTARHHYSVVTARAVAPLPSLVELAAPLLAPGGRLLAWKGAPTAEELAAGEAVAAIVGLRLNSVRSFELPGGDERRSLISYVRIGASRVSLPRREGLAQHSPLA